VTYLGAPESPPRHRHRHRTALRTAASAGAAALVLAASVGAWAAVKLWYRSGEQPETAMPASVSLYGRLDLSPSIDQSMKLLGLARRFPAIAEATGANPGELEREVFTRSELTSLSYDSDVQPWFDHRIGIGTWSDRDSSTYLLAALASTDDAKAGTALEKVLAEHRDGTFGYVVKDGWALLAFGARNGPAAAKDAAAEAAQRSLADNDRFSTALAKLPAAQVALGWSDFDLLKKQLGSATVADGPFGSTVRDLPAELTGYTLAGAQATDDGVELRIRVGGLKTMPRPGENVLPTIAAMPGTTALGLAFSSTGDGRGLIDLGGLSGLSNILGSDGSGDGFDLIKTVLEAKLASVAVQVVKNEVEATATVNARSTTAAQSIESHLNSLAASSTQVRVTRSGDRVEVSSSGYAAASGTLGDQSLYRITMAGMPSSSAVALYCDSTALLTASAVDSMEQAQLAPLKAVGIGAGVEGDEGAILVRAIIR
jgi:hypothetical protein